MTGCRVCGWADYEPICPSCATAEDIPCPDPDHDLKMVAWANKCNTCWGAGVVPTRRNTFVVASGPERIVTRAEDLQESSR